MMDGVRHPADRAKVAHLEENEASPVSRSPRQRRTRQSITPALEPDLSDYNGTIGSRLRKKRRLTASSPFEEPSPDSKRSSSGKDISPSRKNSESQLLKRTNSAKAKIGTRGGEGVKARTSLSRRAEKPGAQSRVVSSGIEGETKLVLKARREKAAQEQGEHKTRRSPIAQTHTPPSGNDTDDGDVSNATAMNLWDSIAGEIIDYCTTFSGSNRRSGDSKCYISTIGASLDLKLRALPILEELAVQILSIFASTPYDQIASLVANKSSKAGRAYVGLKCLFDKTKQVYTSKDHIISAEELQETDSNAVSVVRKANLATYITSCFGSGHLGFFHLDKYFLGTIAPDGNRLLKQQAALFLEVKTQAYLAALQGGGERNIILADMFPESLEQQLLARRPGTTALAASEKDFLQKVLERSASLRDESQDPASLTQLLDKYQWDEFLSDLATYLSRNFETIVGAPLAELKSLEKSGLCLEPTPEPTPSNHYDSASTIDAETEVEYSPLHGNGEASERTSPEESHHKENLDHNDEAKLPPSPQPQPPRQARGLHDMSLAPPGVLENPSANPLPFPPSYGQPPPAPHGQPPPGYSIVHPQTQSLPHMQPPHAARPPEHRGPPPHYVHGSVPDHQFYHSPYSQQHRQQQQSSPGYPSESKESPPYKRQSLPPPFQGPVHGPAGHFGHHMLQAPYDSHRHYDTHGIHPSPQGPLGFHNPHSTHGPYQGPPQPPWSYQNHLPPNMPPSWHGGGDHSSPHGPPPGYYQSHPGYPPPTPPEGMMLAHHYPYVIPSPYQSVPTSVLYERARQVATSKNASSSRSRPSNVSQRRPWSPEEEMALMTGLDTVKGPHWSNILTMHGPTGTVSKALKDRNQVQLKDKARNLKLFFLKSNIEVPYYLSFVTGDLKRASGPGGRADSEMGDYPSGDGQAPALDAGDDHHHVSTTGPDVLGNSVEPHVDPILRQPPQEYTSPYQSATSGHAPLPSSGTPNGQREVTPETAGRHAARAATDHILTYNRQGPNPHSPFGPPQGAQMKYSSPLDPTTQALPPPYSMPYLAHSQAFRLPVPDVNESSTYVSPFAPQPKPQPQSLSQSHLQSHPEPPPQKSQPPPQPPKDSFREACPRKGSDSYSKQRDPSYPTQLTTGLSNNVRQQSPKQATEIPQSQKSGRKASPSQGAKQTEFKFKHWAEKAAKKTKGVNTESGESPNEAKTGPKPVATKEQKANEDDLNGSITTTQPIPQVEAISVSKGATSAGTASELGEASADPSREESGVQAPAPEPRVVSGWATVNR